MIILANLTNHLIVLLNNNTIYQTYKNKYKKDYYINLIKQRINFYSKFGLKNGI